MKIKVISRGMQSLAAARYVHNIFELCVITRRTMWKLCWNDYLKQ